MTRRMLRGDVDLVGPAGAEDVPLIEALRRERRHAAILFLSTGMALGIGFSLALDMAIASVARM